MYPAVIETLIARLTALPGVGRRSAERMVFWLLKQPAETSGLLASGITELKERLRSCRLCNNFTEADLCAVCADPTRDASQLCVVENPKDATAIEKTGVFRGYYFVLLGTVAPSEGQGPDDLSLHKMLRLIQERNTGEVLIATDADIEGELTALHLVRALAPSGVRISRIGIGLPAGGAVEFSDISTLTMSLRARRDVTAHDTEPSHAR